MKAKRKYRIVALLLTFLMVSSTVLANGTIRVAATEEEAVMNAATISSDSDEGAAATSDTDADAADTSGVSNGVVNGEDAAGTGSEAVGEGKTISVTAEQVDADEVDVNLTKESVDSETAEAAAIEYAEDEAVKVIIVFESDSAIESDSTLEAGSDEANEVVADLEAEQNEVLAQVEAEALDGEALDIEYQYTWLLNGVATTVPAGAISAIEAVDGVKGVYIQEMYEALTEEEEDADAYTDSYDTLLAASGTMIGREEVWADGYTGAGIKVAVIDTGLDTDHPSFAALDESALTEDSADLETIESVLTQLNAYANYGPSLSAEKLYLSTKVAYAFNYCDENLDVTHDNDSQGDHGTHVAGIVAANAVEGTDVVGVAPDAQLYIMKVFGSNGGAYTEDIIAALEDAVILGADVINMSLGSDSGFSSSEDEVENQVYETIGKTGIILTVSAGNSATAGSSNLLGYDSYLTENPDNGIVSSPSTYVNTISVASVNNVGETGYYIEADGQEFIYSEGSNGSNDAMSILYGETLEFVMIPNYGEAEDYEGLDVEGKVAVVSRGSTSFIDKQAAAEDAGAVAILVYNNVSDTITADLTDNTASIPFATITQTAGAALQEIYDAAVEAGEAATLWFSDVSKVVASDSGYEMSYFSSWGTTNDLKIEPDITAPGGNIYSTVDNGNYGTYSGTSMSSPMVAGMAALIKQYITDPDTNLLTSEDEDGTAVTEEGLNASELATALLLSTAIPISYDEDTFYSPRLQGNGLANVLNAVHTTAYIAYEDETEPQAELGDDPDKTGNYSFTFDVVNFGDTTLYYDSITTSVQTEDYLEGDDGNTYMASTPVNLDAETEADGSIYIATYDYDEDGSTIAHDARIAYLTLDEISENEQFRYDLDENGTVDTEDVQAYLDALTGKNKDVDLSDEVAAVKAGETATVTVSIQVTEDGMAWMDEHFANGIYVEGYTILSAKGDGVDLAIPYLAFYGDWTSAPMLDDGGYSYLSAAAEEATVSQYYNILWTNYMGEDDSWVPGLNPYLDEDVIDPSHISLSPDGDGYADYISNIYVSLLRNAETLTFTFADAEDEGNVYSETSFSKVVKSTYYSGYGICLPFVLTWYNGNEFWYCTDADGNTLENNDQVTMIVSADLGYTAHEADTTGDVWTETITIDLEAPQLDTDEISVEIAEDGTQTLTITFSDNVDVAAVNFVSKAGSVLAQVAVEQPEIQGDSVTASYDITGYGNSFYVVLGDYAMNESYWLITTTDNLPVLDESLLYGYRTYDDNYSTDTVYGWLSVDPDTGESVVLDSEYYMDYAITAATYVDGYILAVAADYQLYAITPGLWDEWTWIADIGVAIRTLTYDPVEHCLWGFCGSSSSYGLYHIDVETGESYRVSSNYTIATAIACAEDGTLYGITTGGYLRTLDKETGKWVTTELNVDLRSELIAQTDLTSASLSYQQSMVYDAEDDCLYWAAYSYGSGGIYGGLVRLDITEVTTEATEDEEASTELEVTLTVIDTIQGNAEVAGLLKLESMGDYTLPEVEELTDLSIQESNVKMTVGGTTSLTAICTPWYAQNAEIFWSSSDESVVTVDASGKVTAVSVGEAVISVSNADGSLVGTCNVYVLNPDAEMYGFAVYSDNLYNQWITFSGDAVSNYEALTDERISSFIAAEYYNGYIYAYAENGTFYRIDAETFEETELGTWEGMEWGELVLDMAFDYSTGYMYAICDDYGLYAVDLLNGHLTWMAELYDYKDGMAQTLAVDLDGTVYFITETGFLCTYDWDEDWTTEIGLVGVSLYTYNQSMAFDYSTGYLYWAAYGTIYYVDTESGSVLSLGSVDSNLQVIGLFILPDESILPELEEVPVTSVELTEDSVTLLTGMTTTVPVEVLPLNATDRNIVWTVEDPTIATIEGSVITGIGAGTTTAVGTVGEFTVELTIRVIASAGTLYGYIVQDMSMGSGDFWASFSDNALSSGGTGILLTDNYEVYSGEYYDGKVYAFGMDSDSSDYVLMVLDAETFEEEEYWVGGYPSFREMAFDYTTGTLYAVGNARNSTADSYLYMIDTETGSYYTVAQSSASLYGLACSEDGILYAIDSDGILYTMDKATAELTEIGSTGYSATLYQSLAFDYDTGNLYWAQASSVRSGWSYVSTYDFLLVDPEDASVIKLGTVGESGCQVTALFSIPDKEMTVGTPEEATGIVLDTADEVLGVGESFTLTAKYMPISVMSYGDAITFTSSDPTIATVDDNGLVTALKKGIVLITAVSGDLNASCKVAVLDDTSVLYAANSSGLESAQIYTPETIKSSVSYPDGFPTVTNTAYSIDDELYYAVDEDGCLWTYRFDGETFGEVTQVSETAITDQLDNADYFDGSEPAELTDLTINTFNNKLYALVEGHIAGRYVDYNEYYIYEIDTTTGAATAVSAVESDSATPVAFVFTSEDYIVWYDYMVSYIYGQTLSLDDPEEESLAWVQYSFCYNRDYGPLSMVYSPYTNRIYLAGVDYWGLTGSSLGLYEFNVTTNTLSLIGTTAYDKSTFDLIALE